MSDQSENKKPAFPIEDAENATAYGLTKREYFAARAMQGLLSNPEWMKEYKGEKYLMQNDVISEIAIKTADKLLSDLDK